MKIVLHCRDLYRMSDRNFRRYLAAGRTMTDHPPFPDEYGTKIGHITFDATYADSKEFQTYYETYKDWFRYI